jgi:hypothetical protein
MDWVTRDLCLVFHPLRAIILHIFATPGERPVSSTTCVFCDFIRGAAPASVVYADDRVIAFMDIQPVCMSYPVLTAMASAFDLVPGIAGRWTGTC